MIDKKIAGKISRRYTAWSEDIDDMYVTDDMVAMKWRGIPNLKDQDYYVEYIDTTARDILQQATNVFATQRPKWDVIPRNTGADVKTAKEFERALEWYYWLAAQAGRKPFYSETMSHLVLYNRACGQLEWHDNNKYFTVEMHNPKNVLYEYGATIQWVAAFSNMLAADVIEKFSDYAKPNWIEKLTKGDQVGKALRKIQDLVDEDEEQRLMFVDYVDKKKRYTYCYALADEAIDDTFGFDDDGKPNKDFIVIQDKENKLGFINWAIAEGEGDPILAPLSKGKYYDNINDLETMKATNLFRRGLLPLFIKEGREDASPEFEMGGAQIYVQTPTGSKLMPFPTQPIDPGYNEMSAQMRMRMNNSLQLQNVSQVSLSNVQNSTYDAQRRMWLMQYEPYKRAAEKFNEQLAKLMFFWAKKKDFPIMAKLMNSKGSGQAQGASITIKPEQINLDNLYIKCRILENDPNDAMQIANQISIFKNAGIRVPDSQFVEKLDIGDPDWLAEEYEREQLRAAVLNAKLKEISSEVDIMVQTELAKMQAQIQMMTQQAVQQQQMAMQEQAMQQQGGFVPPDGGSPLPSDQAMQGQGFDAAMGGIPPQAASPITQGLR